MFSYLPELTKPKFTRFQAAALWLIALSQVPVNRLTRVRLAIECARSRVANAHGSGFGKHRRPVEADRPRGHSHAAQGWAARSSRRAVVT